MFPQTCRSLVSHLSQAQLNVNYHTHADFSQVEFNVHSTDMQT
jgi:hypothetical protein